MTAVRNVYKVLRSVLFTAILTVIGLAIALYILLSVPAMQDLIRKEAEVELSKFLKSKVEIGRVEILPFNEAKLYDVRIYTPHGEKCVDVEKIAAGIDVWKAVTQGRIVVGYAELIAMNVSVWQDNEGGPLNIRFIIDALAPKDKKEPPKNFDVVLHNVVIRKSSLSFDRRWIPAQSNPRKMDFNHLVVSDLRADVVLPVLRNDDFVVDVRRIAFKEKSGFDLRSLSLKMHITPRLISVSNFKLKLYSSEISLDDIDFSFDGFDNIVPSLMASTHKLVLSASPVVPSEFAAFFPPLANFDGKYYVGLDAVGNLSHLEVNNFDLSSARKDVALSFRGFVNNINTPAKCSFSLDSFQFNSQRQFSEHILNIFNPIPDFVARLILSLGNVELITKGNGDMAKKECEATIALSSDMGNLDTEMALNWKSGLAGEVMAKSDRIDLSGILPDIGIKELGFEVDAKGAVIFSDIAKSHLAVNANIPFVQYKDHVFNDIAVTAEKNSNAISAEISMADPLASFNSTIEVILNGENSSWNLNAAIESFYPSAFGIKAGPGDANISGEIALALQGNNPDNIIGNVNISNLELSSLIQPFRLDYLSLVADGDSHYRHYDLQSSLLSGQLEGNFSFSHLIGMVRHTLATALPSLIPSSESVAMLEGEEFADFKFEMDSESPLFNGADAKYRPAMPIELSGHADAYQGISVNVKAPYIIQGKNKLMRNSSVSLNLHPQLGASFEISSIYPVKRDETHISAHGSSLHDLSKLCVEWEMVSNPQNCGKINLNAAIMKDVENHGLQVWANVDESHFQINGADWQISPAKIAYTDKTVSIDSLHIFHGNQYVDINGVASPREEDAVEVDLAGVNLDYLFSVLNINFVNFGGIATGKVRASGVLSAMPIARTERLFVKNFAYNDCVLGDAEMESHWDMQRKMVAINADIAGDDEAEAKVRGGIYVTRDSLSFEFDTKKLDIEFLQPFMKGFTSSVKGKATGQIHLFGTFADIDLEGWAFADTITMKVDQTNVYYSGSDTIKFEHNKILVPHIRLYDKYGNSGLFSGEVRHRYLHEAEFDFELSDARNLLAYDTDSRFNPKWYGRVFANGSASLKGRPGIVSLDINMATADKSDFTLVLEDTETAADYEFLSFTDSQKIKADTVAPPPLSFEEEFRRSFEKRIIEQSSDIFLLNIALDVTPGAMMNLVMDPAAGDKIRARGSGGLRLQYDTKSDDFLMYGKYTLSEGNYNFSLQDIILKNFKIEPGSSISFNGDPLQGVLDIVAAYRVNTNLTDLDRSFATDPDLTRTNVPVDALLIVKGDINAPDISFDLSLPTVTAEVQRKVKSIISTEDMMNKQAIYLLALNRFYTPEYMGAEQGGEFASVASSTISSQISNMVSSLTDKFSLAPSFKSEKNDFSDMEVDVALSSTLFDNRLILNGNLGYRDRSVSQTTFVGDFDLEYLLSKDGRLRLKAYNHFNDASYYLKSALTTQGVGIVYRKEFDDPFTFLKRMFRRRKKIVIDD